MIGDLKPYPEYEDSGVEWLGEVPAGWEVRRLKQVCSRSALYGANIESERYVPGGVRFLRTTDIRDDGSLQPGGVFVAPDDAAGYLLEDGDLLVSRSGTIGRAFLFSHRMHGDCAYAGYLVRFVPGNSILPQYLFSFTRAAAFADFLAASAIHSTIANVNGEKYGRLPLTVPPVPDQAAIARFLDHVDSRIQRLIAAKERLIELLEEEKQAVIHRAVTRGLDPDVPLKPSGVDWLGDVPEHWKMRKLAQAFRTIGSGTTPSTGNPAYYADGGVPWVMTGDLRDSELTETSKQVTATALADHSALALFPSGSVVVAMYGATIGRTGLLRMPACVNQACCVLAGSDMMSPEYLQALLAGLRQDLVRLAVGGGQPNISQGTVRQFRVPIPPLDEQLAITNALGDSKAGLDGVARRAQRHIALLREYRTRLISDVVTGKLDVREVAARLPDDADADIPAVDDALEQVTA